MYIFFSFNLFSCNTSSNRSTPWNTGKLPLLGNLCFKAFVFIWTCMPLHSFGSVKG